MEVNGYSREHSHKGTIFLWRNSPYENCPQGGLTKFLSPPLFGVEKSQWDLKTWTNKTYLLHFKSRKQLNNVDSHNCQVFAHFLSCSNTRPVVTSVIATVWPEAWVVLLKIMSHTEPDLTLWQSQAGSSSLQWFKMGLLLMTKMGSYIVMWYELMVRSCGDTFVQYLFIN